MATVLHPRIKGNDNLVLAARVERVENELDQVVFPALSHSGVTLAELQADTKKILAYLEPAEAMGRAALPVWRFATKHSGRIIPFALGVAVAGGWINPEFAAQIKMLFGLA